MKSRIANTACLDWQVGVQLLVLNTKLRPADILIHLAEGLDAKVVRPIACDVTIVSMFKDVVLTKATSDVGGAAKNWHRNKVTDLERKLSQPLLQPSETTVKVPNFDFQSLDFDYLGRLSPGTILFMKILYPRVTGKFNTSVGAIRTRIYSHISGQSGHPFNNLFFERLAVRSRRGLPG